MDHILPCLAFVILPSSLTCGCTVQPGLTNAPQLGGTTIVDPRVHDVIANGPDSCGRNMDSGPLRYRVIPCPRGSPSPSQPPPSARSPSAPRATGATSTLAVCKWVNWQVRQSAP
jgi:hypothetical protein